MKGGDIGMISDTDETLSRDFLRAMQICEVQEFDAHNNCRQPKVSAMNIIFEGSPYCVSSKFWGQPALVSACEAKSGIVVISCFDSP